MAEVYKMGQYRYAPGECTDNITSLFTAHPLYVSVSEGSDFVFQDICIRGDNGSSFYFKENEPYYLSIDIPQNMNYDLELTIKMTDCDDKSNYQVIKKIVVPRNAGADTKNYRACMWEKTKDTDLILSFPCEINGSGEIVDQFLGTVEPTVDLLLYNGENPYTYITSVNGQSYTTEQVYGAKDVVLNAAWDSKDITLSTLNYEFVFSPKVPSNELKFQEIHIDMTRIPEDSDIISSKVDDGTGNMKFLTGRYLDVNNLKFELHKINSILPKEIDSCNRIGVWGPSGLLMSINGEPVRVGPSGYYELKDFDITSLGVYVPEKGVSNVYQNNFTVDYQYLVK